MFEVQTIGFSVKENSVGKTMNVIRPSNCQSNLLIHLTLKMYYFWVMYVSMINRCFSALSYLATKERNNAPHTPRVLLLGPPGSGKSVQASLLSSKYELVHGKVHEPFHLVQFIFYLVKVFLFFFLTFFLFCYRYIMKYIVLVSPSVLDCEAINACTVWLL